MAESVGSDGLTKQNENSAPPTISKEDAVNFGRIEGIVNNETKGTFAQFGTGDERFVVLPKSAIDLLGKPVIPIATMKGTMGIMRQTEEISSLINHQMENALKDPKSNSAGAGGFYMDESGSAKLYFGDRNDPSSFAIDVVPGNTLAMHPRDFGNSLTLSRTAAEAAKAAKAPQPTPAQSST